MSPHQIRGILRSDVRFVTQRLERLRAWRRRWHLARSRKPLRPGQMPGLPIAVYHARADDIYPASLRPSHAAGRMLPASIRSIQTRRPGLEPRQNYDASESLPIRSWLQCNTKREARTECVAQTDTDGRRGAVRLAPRLRGLRQLRAWAAKRKTASAIRRWGVGSCASTGRWLCLTPGKCGPEHFFFRRRFSRFGYCAATMGCSTATGWGRRVTSKTDAEGSVLVRMFDESSMDDYWPAARFARRPCLLY